MEIGGASAKGYMPVHDALSSSLSNDLSHLMFYTYSWLSISGLCVCACRYSFMLSSIIHTNLSIFISSQKFHLIIPIIIWYVNFLIMYSTRTFFYHSTPNCSEKFCRWQHLKSIYFHLLMLVTPAIKTTFVTTAALVVYSCTEHSMSLKFLQMLKAR